MRETSRTGMMSSARDSGAGFTFTMALYLCFSCWYVTLYFSTGSRDRVLLNSLRLLSEAQRTSFGSRSVENQAGVG